MGSKWNIRKDLFKITIQSLHVPEICTRSILKLFQNEKFTYLAKIFLVIWFKYVILVQILLLDELLEHCWEKNIPVCIYAYMYACTYVYMYVMSSKDLTKCSKIQGNTTWYISLNLFCSYHSQVIHKLERNSYPIAKSEEANIMQHV